MKNKIGDLRNHLFLTIEQLLDEDSDMDVKKAQSIANVANSIINSAKVENEFIKITGGTKSNFIGILE